MTEAEIIQEQRKKIEALESQLANGLPTADKLNDFLASFSKQTAPGVEGINKTITQLESTAKGLEGMVSLLSKMTAKDVEKLMKRK